MPIRSSDSRIYSGNKKKYMFVEISEIPNIVKFCVRHESRVAVDSSDRGARRAECKRRSQLSRVNKFELRLKQDMLEYVSPFDTLISLVNTRINILVNWSRYDKNEID